MSRVAWGAMEFDWRNPRAILRSQILLWPILLVGVTLPDARDGADAGFLIAMLAVLLAFGGFWLWHPHSDHRVGKDIAALRRSWRWFAGRSVTIAPMPAAEQIEQAAEPHGFRVIELDGRSVRSLADLGAALQAHTKPMRWPEEPLAHALALLRQIAMGTPRRTLVVWRHADASLRHDAAMVPNVVAEHTAQSVLLPLGLLLFVDLPPPVAVATEPAPSAIEPPLPASLLQHAPEGAWWKPVPGELLR